MEKIEGKMENNSRIRYVDTAKLISMFMVVLAFLPLYKTKAITLLLSVSTGAFFFLSGFTFKKDLPLLLSIKKAILHLLLPYLVFYVFIWIWPFQEGNLRYLVHYTFSKGIKAVLPYWKEFFRPDIMRGLFVGVAQTQKAQSIEPILCFLLSLFSTKVIASLISRMFSKDVFYTIAQGVASFICIILAFTFGRISQILPWSLVSCFMLYPFFALGSIISPYCRKLAIATCKKQRLILAIIALLSFVVCVLLCKLNCGTTLDITKGLFGNNIVLFYLMVVCGIMGIVAVSLCVELPKVFDLWTQNTIVIMAFFGKWTTPYFMNGIQGNLALHSGGIIAILSIALCILPILLITKSCPFVLGRFENKNT